MPLKPARNQAELSAHEPPSLPIHAQDVVVYAERGPDGGVRARAHDKDRGMER